MDAGRHRYESESKSWGFPKFMRLADLANADKGFIKDNRIIVEAQIDVQKVCYFNLVTNKTRLYVHSNFVLNSRREI